MTRRLESVYFAHEKIPHWLRLARVLKRSAERHCPGWSVRVATLLPRDIRDGNGPRTYTSNTQKLDRWAEIVASAPDGDEILLIDTDTVILRSLDDIWGRSFDVAYTEAARFPINGGVVFVRVSSRSREFMAAWAAENRRLLFDNTPRPTWRKAYGGINQASFCLLRESGRVSADLMSLPCAEWNCEDSTWSQFDPAVTRILHVKSALRLSCIGPMVQDQFRPLVAAWRSAERMPEMVEA